jgi:hypothetical protein
MSKSMTQAEPQKNFRPLKQLFVRGTYRSDAQLRATQMRAKLSVDNNLIATICRIELRFFRGNGLTHAERRLLKFIALTGRRIDHPDESID